MDSEKKKRQNNKAGEKIVTGIFTGGARAALRDPHENLFYYYRGASENQKKHEIQLENNLTKALINTLDLSDKQITDDFLGFIGLPKQKNLPELWLQIGYEKSVVDAEILLENRKIAIENKLYAALRTSQIRNHLKKIKACDRLLVITKKRDDEEIIKERFRGERRIIYKNWENVYCFFREEIEKINHKKISVDTLSKELIEQFLKYLELIDVAPFEGFEPQDFDFFIEGEEIQKTRVKNNLESLAKEVQRRLPKKIRKKFNILRPGNISTSGGQIGSGWIAIQTKGSHSNFTLELDRGTFEVNLVIRDGKYTDDWKPIGIFYNFIKDKPTKFLGLLKNIDKDTDFRISKRIPKNRTSSGRPVFRGGENWEVAMEIALDHQIKLKTENIKKTLELIKYPGITIAKTYLRGDPILTNKDKLVKKCVEMIKQYEKVLDAIGVIE